MIIDLIYKEISYSYPLELCTLTKTNCDIYKKYFLKDARSAIVAQQIIKEYIARNIHGIKLYILEYIKNTSLR